MRWFIAYYRKDPTFFPAKEISIATLSNDFARVRTFLAEDVEDAFRIQQGEIWSPNGEARPLIEFLGLHHTSMSVGDLLVDVENKKLYEVDVFGFKEIVILKGGENGLLQEEK